MPKKEDKNKADYMQWRKEGGRNSPKVEFQNPFIVGVVILSVE